MVGWFVPLHFPTELQNVVEFDPNEQLNFYWSKGHLHKSHVLKLVQTFDT